MSLSLVQSRALLGLEAASVTVEVHLANGLPSFTLVGLAETEVKEARERVRSAIQNAGLEFPNNKKIVVNLAPADLPKDSGRFDLPIALGILAASGQIESARLAGHEFAGELSLSGELRPVRGALAMALALHTRGVATRLVLPLDSAQEAALVPGGEVYGARHLLDVVRQFIAEGDAAASQLPDAPGDGWARVQAAPGTAAPLYADLADVKGHAGAKRVLEIAAAGGHSLLMVGEPGSGKSMLAQRFAGLLPAMSIDEALETAAVASLGGRFATERWMNRPTSAPHHTSSAVALVGGGSPPRPGEISRAHHGVLFLVIALIQFIRWEGPNELRGNFLGFERIGSWVAHYDRWLPFFCLWANVRARDRACPTQFSSVTPRQRPQRALARWHTFPASSMHARATTGHRAGT
jgi:magnesium chelatase family protein